MTVQQAREMFEQAIADLMAGRFQPADEKIQHLLETIGGAAACHVLQGKILLRLAQGRPAEARNITSFLAYTYTDDALAQGWGDLLCRLSGWSFLAMLLVDYRRALETYLPTDSAWPRVTRFLPVSS
jgi:hypothetical protein